MLLNKNYPLKEAYCKTTDFQREMKDTTEKEEIYNTIKKTFIAQGVVFFGGYAVSLYSQYMPKKLKRKLSNSADFEVLSYRSGNFM